jgi:glycosyltransferase involved in cell wall biosynthesis
MRIVHALGWYFPESVGGTETYVAALARTLRSLGQDVSIAAPDPDTDDVRTYDHEDIPVFRYPIPSRPTRQEVQQEVPVRGTGRFHEWLRHRKPDVFHCHSLVTGLGIAEIELAREMGAKVVVTCHTPGLGYICQRGTMMHWGEELCDGLAAPGKCAPCELQHRGLPRALATVVGRISPAASREAARIPGKIGSTLGMASFIKRNVSRQKWLVDRVDAMVLLTEWARQTVCRNVGSADKLHLNRLGAEWTGPQPRRTRAPSTPLRLGYLGRFDPIKGVLVLAKALAIVARDLDFVMEFRGPLGSKTEERVRTLCAGDRRVRFEPAVPPAEVSRVLASWDVLLCPSIALEGGPTVAIEAHAVGTPVIGSRIGGLAEIVEDGVNGLLLPPGNVTALAQAIENVVREPASTVSSWFSRVPTARTMDQVTRDYLALYGAGGFGNCTRDE